MSSFSVKDQRITISDDSGVLNTIKRCFGINLGITLRDQSIWIGDLCSVWHTIKNMAAREHISVPSDLESFVDAEVARRTEMARSNVSESESVSFDELMFLFEPNDRIVVTVDGHQMGAIFNSAVPVLINSMRFTSRFDINGRQIKNVVRTSQTLARARGIDTDAKLISSVISKTIDSIASLKDT